MRKPQAIIFVSVMPSINRNANGEHDLPESLAIALGHGRVIVAREWVYRKARLNQRSRSCFTRKRRLRLSSF